MVMPFDLGLASLQGVSGTRSGSWYDDSMVSEGLFGKTYRIASARLKEWDYSSPGHYSVTICTKDNQCFFGDIVEVEEEPGAAIQFSPAGQIIGNSWKMIPRWYPNVSLDDWQIMPNH